MRNLKRVLALAMAMVMILGMMVIGSSAASYADEAQIDATYAEAVDVLSGLEVMRGQGTGFAPKANIMRSEVAAIIYRIATKDVEDEQVGIYADYAKFNDVDAAAWYAGYVGYCANATYLKGYDGNVNPTGLVTGYQALAMILRVMGYDQNGEFTGEGWDIRTASTAQALGILKNINTSTLGLPATRETVAEMVFQAMQCSKVSYTHAFGYQKTGSSLMDEFGAIKVAGVIGDTTLADGETMFIDGYTTKTTSGIFNWKVETSKINVTVTNTDADWQNVGYAAYVWAVGLKNNTAKAITDVVVTGKDLSVTTDGTDITGAYSLTNPSKLNPYYVASLADNYDVVINGEYVNSLADIDNVIGTKIALVDNNKDGKVDAVIATEYTAVEVNNVVKYSLTGNVFDFYYSVLGLKSSDDNGYIEPEQLIGVDALAKNDVFTYVKVDDNDEDAKEEDDVDYYVTMAAVDSADFTAITWETIAGAKEETYTIGGTEYVASWRTGNTQYADLKEGNLNETVVFTTDEYGYLLTAKLYKDPAAYLFVMDNEDSHGIKNLAETEVAYADGSVAEIEVACKGDVEDGELADRGLTPKVYGEIYAYTTNKAGNIELDMDTVDFYAEATYLDNSVIFADEEVTSRTTFVDLRDVLKGKASVGTVYNGYLELPGITGAKIVYTLHKVTGAMDLCFIIGGTNTSDLTDSFVVFNTDINVQTAVKAGNQKIYTYTLKAGVITANELVENYKLTEKQAAAIDTYGVGYYQFDENGDLEKYTSFEADKVTWTPESNGTVVYKGIDITDDYGLHFLDISKGKYHSWGQIVTDGEYYAIVNPIKKIAYIVADATVDTVDPDYTILANAADKGAVVYGDEVTEDAYADLIYTVVDYKVTDVEEPDVETFDTAAPFSVTIAGKPVAAGETVTLTYAEYAALETAGVAPVVVTPAEGNKIAVKNETTFVDTVVNTDITLNKTAGKTTTLTVYSQGNLVGADGKVIAVTKSYTYKATWTAAQTGAVLVSDGADTVVTTVADNKGEIQVANGTEPAYKLAADSTLADVTVEGNTVTVVSEDKLTTNVYTIVYGAFASVNDADEVFYANGSKIDLAAGEYKYTKGGVAQSNWVGSDYQVTSDIIGDLTFNTKYEVKVNGEDVEAYHGDKLVAADYAGAIKLTKVGGNAADGLAEYPITGNVELAGVYTITVSIADAVKGKWTATIDVDDEYVWTGNKFSVKVTMSHPDWTTGSRTFTVQKNGGASLGYSGTPSASKAHTSIGIGMESIGNQTLEVTNITG